MGRFRAVKYRSWNAEIEEKVLKITTKPHHGQRKRPIGMRGMLFAINLQVMSSFKKCDMLGYLENSLMV